MLGGASGRAQLSGHPRGRNQFRLAAPSSGATRVRRRWNFLPVQLRARKHFLRRTVFETDSKIQRLRTAVADAPNRMFPAIYS